MSILLVLPPARLHLLHLHSHYTASPWWLWVPHFLDSTACNRLMLISQCQDSISNWCASSRHILVLGQRMNTNGMQMSLQITVREMWLMVLCNRHFIKPPVFDVLVVQRCRSSLAAYTSSAWYIIGIPRTGCLMVLSIDPMWPLWHSLGNHNQRIYLSFAEQQLTLPRSASLVGQGSKIA